MAKKLRDLIRASVGIDDSPRPVQAQAKPKQVINPFNHPMRAVGGGKLKDIIRRSVGIQDRRVNKAKPAVSIQCQPGVTPEQFARVISGLENRMSALVIKSRVPQGRPSASDYKKMINRNARRPSDGVYHARTIAGSTDNAGRSRKVLSVRDAVRRSVGLNPKREFRGQGYSSGDAAKIERAKMVLRSGGNLRDAASIVGMDLAQKLEASMVGARRRNQPGYIGYIDPYTGGKFVSYEAYLKYGFKPQPRGVPAPVGMSRIVG